jgi:hypothetical protein
MNARDRKFVDAERVIEESLIVRTIARTATFVGRAFPPSPRLRRTAEALAEAGQARRPATLKGSPHVMSGIIITIAAGCLTHAVLLQWMPDRIAPVKPLAYGMVVAFGAFAAVAGFITTRSNATATADSSAGTANTRKS